MGQPQNCPEIFPGTVDVRVSPQGEFIPSQGLIDILESAREQYAWRDAPLESQQTVIQLEAEVSDLLDDLTPESAQQIISKVSLWGGNNKNSQRAIDSAPIDDRERMQRCIEVFGRSDSPHRPLHDLCDLRGISLVMASKIYRFCFPDQGASVDRHSSYFFNSLPLSSCSKRSGFATNFKREWSKGTKAASRLAIYHDTYLRRNLEEYTNVYLHLLERLAQFLNEQRITFNCICSGKSKEWTSADVEMAAYHWWSQNGVK